MRKLVRRWGAIIVAALAVLTLFAALLMNHIHSFYEARATKQADCVVVFGAAVAPDAKPTRALRDRTTSAAELYTRGLASCIVLSGAPSVYGAHEVDVMRELALQEGVQIEDLIFDFEGLNTLQTVQNLDKEKSYILVSNDFHLARINLLARRAGVTDFVLHASTYNNGRPQDELYWVVREMTALLYYFFVTM